MAGNKVNIKLVSLAEPCTACNILEGLLMEILEKVKNELDNVEIEVIKLKHINEAHTVEGLEVEKFPAIIINNEQITAGSLVTKNQLISWIQSGGFF